jgi:hypothetical protein
MNHIATFPASVNPDKRQRAVLAADVLALPERDVPR